MPSTVSGNGDRTGYKLGGDDIAADHVVLRSGTSCDSGRNDPGHRNPGP